MPAVDQRSGRLVSLSSILMVRSLAGPVRSQPSSSALATVRMDSSSFCIHGLTEEFEELLFVYFYLGHLLFSVTWWRGAGARSRYHC
jgi:hypothetical protein